jgi:hypothetical protein
MPLRPADGHARPTAADRAAGDRAAGSRRGTGHRSGLRLTGRGAVALMLVVFAVGNLIGAELQSGWPSGLGYLAGCLLAVCYVRRDGLLLLVATPPLIFFITLVGAELACAQGGTVLATAEGTMLALAAASGWLLVGTAGYLAIALVRGLPGRIRSLNAELSGRPRQER